MAALFDLIARSALPPSWLARSLVLAKAVVTVHAHASHTKEGTPYQVGEHPMTINRVKLMQGFSKLMQTGEIASFTSHAAAKAHVVAQKKQGYKMGIHLETVGRGSKAFHLYHAAGEEGAAHLGKMGHGPVPKGHEGAKQVAPTWREGPDKLSARVNDATVVMRASHPASATHRDAAMHADAARGAIKEWNRRHRADPDATHEDMLAEGAANVRRDLARARTGGKKLARAPKAKPAPSTQAAAIAPPGKKPAPPPATIGTQSVKGGSRSAPPGAPPAPSQQAEAIAAPSKRGWRHGQPAENIGPKRVRDDPEQHAKNQEEAAGYWAQRGAHAKKIKEGRDAATREARIKELGGQEKIDADNAAVEAQRAAGRKAREERKAAAKKPKPAPAAPATTMEPKAPPTVAPAPKPVPPPAPKPTPLAPAPKPSRKPPPEAASPSQEAAAIPAPSQAKDQIAPPAKPAPDHAPNADGKVGYDHPDAARILREHFAQYDKPSKEAAKVPSPSSKVPKAPKQAKPSERSPTAPPSTHVADPSGPASYSGQHSTEGLEQKSPLHEKVKPGSFSTPGGSQAATAGPETPAGVGAQDTAMGLHQERKAIDAGGIRDFGTRQGAEAYMAEHPEHTHLFEYPKQIGGSGQHFRTSTDEHAALANREGHAKKVIGKPPAHEEGQPTKPQANAPATAPAVSAPTGSSLPKEPKAPKPKQPKPASHGEEEGEEAPSPKAPKRPKPADHAEEEQEEAPAPRAPRKPKAPRPEREPRESREPREPRAPREPKESKEAKEARKKKEERKKKLHNLLHGIVKTAAQVQREHVPENLHKK